MVHVLVLVATTCVQNDQYSSLVDGPCAGAGGNNLHKMISTAVDGPCAGAGGNNLCTK